MSAATLDLFAPGTFGALLLCGLRVGGLLMVAPVFSSRSVPVALRASLLFVLTLLMLPLTMSAHPEVPGFTAAAVARELLIGFALGLGAAVFVGAAEVAGELLSVHIGLGGAAVLDPLTFESVPVLGPLAHLFAVVVLLSVNAHLVMLDALAGSLHALPLGAPVDVAGGLAAMVGIGSTLFVLGLRLAAPVVAVVLLANVALAVLNRAVPQLNALAVGFPLQIGVGLLALSASLPLLGALFTQWDVAYGAVVSGLMDGFAGRGGR